ncbi:hypothetical protein, partial [Asaia astilbis]|uniref:hypothetical protein n=1 Tax=Asaia astilbis TaxID=610244 RepID=UPI00055CEE9C
MTHGQKPESAFYTNTIKMTLQPDPFKIGMPGGTISFFKGGRVTSDFPDPDEAAKIFLHYVEQHYQRHIIEAEARGAAEQSRKDAEGQEPVGYLSATGLEQIASQLHGYANLRRSRGSAEFARKWGPDIPLYD